MLKICLLWTVLLDYLAEIIVCAREKNRRENLAELQMEKKESKKNNTEF